MPRTKAVKQYEVDFEFPERRGEALLLKDDGTDLYDIPQLLAIAERSTGNYALQFVPSVKAQWADQGALSESQHITLRRIAAPVSDEAAAIDQKFFDWYDARPDMQETYKSVLNESWWVYDKYGEHHSQEGAQAKGFHERPDGWRMFKSVVESWAGSKFRELKRDVVYDIGDMVQLRVPFTGNWRYDPLMANLSWGVPPPPKDTPRIGTVVEHTEDIHRRSRGGKGSRLINVLWLSSGTQVAVPERVLKKLPKQKA